MVQDAVKRGVPWASIDITTSRKGQVAFWFTAMVYGLISMPIVMCKWLREGRFAELATLLVFEFPSVMAGGHDAFVSALRAYSPDQFRAICKNVEGIENCT